MSQERSSIHSKIFLKASSVLKTKLLKHQEQTVKFALDKKFIFDLSCPGSGKSLSALAVIDAVGKKALIICPPHLVSNWLHEIEKHTDLRGCPHYKKFTDEKDVYVVAYTRISEAEDIFKNVKMVFIDECHYLKSLESKRTQAVHNMLYKYVPEYLVMMTGTILKNRVPEIYSPLILLGLGKHVYPKILDHYKSYYVFCCRFTNVKHNGYGTVFSGSKNIEELRTFIKPYAIKHGDEVLNLPEMTETKVVVSYKDDPELMKAFNEFNGGVASGTNISAKAKSAEFKAPFTASYVSSLIDQDCGPVVVFSDHRKSIAIIELELSKRRVRSITGETPMERRAEYVKMLNSGQLDALICSIGSSSSGLTLTGANRMVFNDLCFTPGDLEQAKKRIHRVSQTKPCQLTFVVGSKADDDIINMLNGKTKTINKVLGGI